MTEQSLSLEAIEKLKEERLEAEERYMELELIHQSTIEHSTNIENDLEVKNVQINQYVDGMKKYLSPQLFQKVTGSGNEDGPSLVNNKRKKLTIFFSDLVGFSSITDTVEPEVLSQCLNYYLDRMSKIALKYDGTIDKFIGDAIMIFFGDSDSSIQLLEKSKLKPDAYNATACVKMALEMQDDMKWVNDYWHKAGITQPLKIRIGINTGYATVGNYGTDQRMDYTIIGGQVNIAARLESAAAPGSICISDATNSLVQTHIQTDNLGKITVKGIHAPIFIHNAIRVKSEDEGNLPTDNYITIKEDKGMILKEIVYNVANSHTYSSVEKTVIIDSLLKAINFIKKH